MTASKKTTARRRTASASVTRENHQPHSNTRLPVEVIEAIDIVAAEMTAEAQPWGRVTRSDVIRLAVKQFLEQRQATKK